MTGIDPPSSRWARLDKLASIAFAAAALAAFAILPSAAFASAATSSQPSQASEFSEEEGGGGGGGEAEEGWEGEGPDGDGGWIELEEDFEGEELEEGTASSLPSECVLRTVRPEATLEPAHEKLRLTLRYTSRIPTRAGLGLSLRGGRGSLRMGSAKRQLGRSGVLHLSRHLDPRTLARARAARSVVVRLDVPAAPSSCRSQLTLRLTAKQVLGDRATWSVPLERRRS